MSEDELTTDERATLLALARQALESGVRGEPIAPLALDELPASLRQTAASFVTLTIAGQLRGCIGSIEPYQPLAEDIRQHAIAAALNDYRFFRVQPDELPQIAIEISRLTNPQLLAYDGPDDLLSKIRPGIDGLVLRDGIHRATFLPQVWEKLPDPVDFLDQLCLKMGRPPDTWRRQLLEVEIYQVEEFHE